MKILQTDATLEDRRKKNPQSRPLVGDLACLKGGRVVARYRLNFSDGTTAWALRGYALDRDPPELLTTGATPKDWWLWISEEIERGQGRFRELGPHEFVPADELEHARFRELWPHTAAFLKTPLPPTRSPLFPVGRVHYLSGWFDIEWRRLLQRHDSGDHGVYGKADATPLTDEEAWALAEQPVLVQNKAAIAAKSGPIRSRFPVADASGRQSRIVAVVTVLSPRGPCTLMTATGADADLKAYP